MDTTSALKALTGLSQESRLAIFRLLVEQGPAGIAAGQIAERVGLPPATTSFHLKELVNAGLARPRPESRFIYYTANYDAMNGLVAYLTENCCRQSGTCRTDCAPDRAPSVVPSTDARAMARRRIPSKSAKRRVA